MKKFLIHSALFLLPIFVAFATMEILLRNIENDYSYKRKYLDQHAEEIETLVLGSSHAYNGVNPVFLSSKGFNAAYHSQHFRIDFAIYGKYHDSLESLQTIVVPISLMSFWRNRDDVEKYETYMHLDFGRDKEKRGKEGFCLLNTDSSALLSLSM